LEKSNDIIKTLKDRLFEVEFEKKDEQNRQNNLAQTIGTLNQKIEDKELELNKAYLILEKQELNDEQKIKLDSIKDEVFAQTLNLNNIKPTKEKIREYIQKDIEKSNGYLQRLSSSIISHQNSYINSFPVLAKELDAKVQYCDEFIKKLDELKKDNLPKYKKRFKELLKEKTIHKILTL